MSKGKGSWTSQEEGAGWLPTIVHLYNADPQSGAGNCTCGAPERHRRHFHVFVEAAGVGGPGGNPRGLCTCALPRESRAHW